MTFETGADVLRVIEAIAATPSRIEKETLLADLAGERFGKWVLKWTYDPHITYGVKGPFKGGDTAPPRKLLRDDLDQVTVTLAALASRMYSGTEAMMQIAMLLSTYDTDSTELLARILNKDLRCGIAAVSINKVMPGLVPTFAVMRAQAYEPAKVKSWPLKAEFKLDGQRNTFVCRNEHGAFFTRSGKHVPALDFLVEPIMAVAAAVVERDEHGPLRPVLLDEKGELSFVLDGEAMMGLFKDTGALRRKDVAAEGAELHLYDIMSFADFDATGAVGLTLVERRQLLSEFCAVARDILDPNPIQIVPQYFVNSDAEVNELFQIARSMTLAKYLARGDKTRERTLLQDTLDEATGAPKVLEGLMLKTPDGLYEKRKCWGWMKLKAEETEDLRIVDAFSGETGTKYEDCLGGLIVDRNGVQVRVGGGFTDVQRVELWEAFKRDMAVGHWSSPGPNPEVLGRLIEVEFHEVTPDGSLRHPRFVRFRDDKDGEMEK